MKKSHPIEITLISNDEHLVSFCEKIANEEIAFQFLSEADDEVFTRCLEISDLLLFDYDSLQSEFELYLHNTRTCWRNIPFVVLSQSADSQLIIKLFRAGISDFLIKNKNLLFNLTEFKTQLIDSYTNYWKLNQYDKYHLLFERSEDAVLVIENNHFIDCNSATLNILGLHSKEELLNVHPSELSPENQPDGKDSREKFDHLIDIALQRGHHRFEWLHKRNDDEIFQVDVQLTAVRFDGKIILLTIWRDWTCDITCHF